MDTVWRQCTHTFTSEALDVKVLVIWQLDGLTFASLATPLTRYLA